MSDWTHPDERHLDAHGAEKDPPWSCPDCPWVHAPHPAYGWAQHDTRAIEVHRTMLCPGRAQ